MTRLDFCRVFVYTIYMIQDKRKRRKRSEGNMWSVRKNDGMYEVITPEGKVRCKVKDWWFALSIAEECEKDREADLKQKRIKKVNENG